MHRCLAAVVRVVRPSEPEASQQRRAALRWPPSGVPFVGPRTACCITTFGLRSCVPASGACTSGKSTRRRNRRKRGPRWPNGRERPRAPRDHALRDSQGIGRESNALETSTPAESTPPGPTQSAPFRRIAVCADGSDVGEVVVLHAAKIAAGPGAPLTIVRVLEPDANVDATPPLSIGTFDSVKHARLSRDSSRSRPGGTQTCSQS